MSTLYLVATPIGNLADITQRAIETLKNVSLIAAEDTRKTRRLLTQYEIGTPVTSYHEHNKKSKLPYLLSALEEGDIALVSDAGMPGINDPGYDIVQAAIQRDIQVVPIPGPSAITTALAASGITAEQFTHLGFLPRKTGARKKLLAPFAEDSRTITAFETPHRILSALADIYETLGDRRIAVCREMSKLHEEIFRGTVSEAINHFAKPKGEFTLVIEGKSRKKAPNTDSAEGFPL